MAKLNRNLPALLAFLLLAGTASAIRATGAARQALSSADVALLLSAMAGVDQADPSGPAAAGSARTSRS